MAIPDYQTVMRPLLRLVGQRGSISVRDVTEQIAEEFKLTKDERAALLLSGKQVLAEKPKLINVSYLNKFPEFEAFRAIENEKEDNSSRPVVSSESIGTPEELLEQSYRELKTALLDDIIQRVKSCSPQFLEKLVVDTVVKMGYGGSRKEAGKAIGQSGDEGIDGIINEDRLGLDVIYLQVKRWE